MQQQAHPESPSRTAELRLPVHRGAWRTLGAVVALGLLLIDDAGAALGVVAAFVASEVIFDATDASQRPGPTMGDS
ncbi:MAG TPA: hypothetical protein VD859_17290 [Nocardioides sp.]|nr:hypothetical protein [Nocardioides sp.]